MQIGYNTPIPVGYRWKVQIALYPSWLSTEIVENTPIRLGYPWKLHTTLLYELVIHGNYIQHSYPSWLLMLQTTLPSQLVIHGIADNTPIRVGYPWKLQITLLSELVIHGNRR